MDKFSFEEPSIKKKDEIIEYLNEFKEFKSDINGTGGLDKIFKGLTFEQALERCLNLKDEDYAKSIERSPSITFLLIRKSDNKIVGTLNLRWNLNETMKYFGGNIGYGIRPLERRKGYNKIQLYLGLIEAKKIGLKKVMIDCSADNVASDKSILALGGVLERSGIDPSDGVLTNVYWLDTEECINKHKDEYEQYIDNKSGV